VIASDTFSYASFTDSTLDNYAFTPHYTLDSTLAGCDNRLLAGIDFGMDVLDLQSFGNLARTLPEKNTDATLRRANAGAYVQDEFSLAKELVLTLGSRQEIYRYSSNVQDVFGGTSSDGNTTYHQTAGDAALVYHPTDKMRFFGRVSSIYRDPFLDELTSAYYYGGYGPAMDTGLRPETGLQYELGASATLAEDLTADLSVYRLDMHDEIAYDMATYANRNLDDTRRYGADAALTWARKEIGLVSLSYNYVDATFDQGPNEGCRIPLVPAHVLTLHGELELPWDLAALATAHAVSDQFLGNDNANQSVKLPTYGTLDLGLRYHPHQIQDLDVLVGVDNVFDAIYANSGYFYGTPSYYPAAGRTWKVTAMYRF